MPIGPFPDFAACVAHMTKPKEEGGGGYDEETAKKVCGELKAKLEGKVPWQGTINIEGNKVVGQALHPIKTYHPDEWPELRVYLEEELKKSAETLTGKPFGIDHLYLLPEPNKASKGWWENDAICYEGDVDDATAEMIRKGQIRGVSVEYDWDILQNVNGVAPKGLEFTSLHFLKNLEPGDPSAYVKLLEAIVAKLKETRASLAPNPVGVQASPTPPKAGGVESLNEEELKNLVYETVATAIREELQKRGIREAEWDTEWINNLPDSAFAVIGSGGEKDAEGKTVPRTLRHLPHHNAQGDPDLPHLRNALARMNQIEPASLQPEAKKHLCAHAKDSEIVSEFCGEEPPKAQEGAPACPAKPSLPEALISSTGPQSSDLISRKEVLAKIDAIIPPPQVVFSHGQTGGFKRLAENIQRVKREIEGAKAVG